MIRTSLATPQSSDENGPKLPIIFLGYPFALNDLLVAVKRASKGLARVVVASDKLRGKPLLEKIEEMMSEADLCLFDLTTHNPNVAVEFGIARGVGYDVALLYCTDEKLNPKPEQESSVFSDLKGWDSILYRDKAELRTNLRRVLPDLLEKASQRSLQRPTFRLLDDSGKTQLFFSVVPAPDADTIDQHIASFVPEPDFNGRAILGYLWERDRDYDSYVIEFIPKYRSYLEARFTTDCRTLEFKLALENIGARQGDSVSIVLQIVAIGSIYDKRPAAQAPPATPQRFKQTKIPGFQYLGNVTEWRRAASPSMPRVGPAIARTSTGPEITQSGNEFIVKYWCSAVRQHDSTALRPFYILLPMHLSTPQMEIRYTIRAANADGIDEGTLPVNFKVGDTVAMRSWLHKIRGELTGTRKMEDDATGNASG